MKNNQKKLILIAVTLLIMLSSNASAYIPPIGIPAPSFGIEEVAPEPPGAWPNAEATGFYYIDNTHINATDEDNTYGYPNKPRLTPPFGNAVLPAGSYIEINGQSGQTYSGGALRMNCTFADPCWFRGSDGVTQPTFTSTLIIEQSQYVIVEQITSDGATDSSIRLKHPGGGFATSHISIRNNTISNNVNSSVNSAAVSFYPGSNSTMTDLVFYKNSISDAGNNPGVYTMDGFALTGRDGGDERIWVLENTITNVTGLGIDLNGPDYVYIGKNTIIQPYINGMELRGSSNSIASQNIISGARAENSSVGAGIYIRYPEDNVWLIFNRLYDNAVGIYGSSSSTGTYRFYVVGNWIYDNIYNGSTENNGLGIQFLGPISSYYVDNVIDNTRGGITYRSSGDSQELFNNLITNTYGAQHIYGGNPSKNGLLDIQNNFFGETAKVWFNNRDYQSLSDFTAGVPSQCTTCKENIDPLYVDRVNADSALKNFNVETGSPVIGQSSEHAIYQTFIDNFGLDIRVDFQKEPRPVGAVWDLGSDQFFNTAIAPSIVNTSIINGTQHVPYSQTLSNTNGLAPFTWSSTGSLPTGITLSSAGVLSGIPTVPNTDSFSVTVTDANSATGTQLLNLTIVPAPDLSITKNSLTSAVINTTYSDSLTAIGGKPAYSWSVITGSLPSGINLNVNTGLLSGTATESGTFNVTFRATDALLETVDSVLEIIIHPEVLIDETSLINAVRDIAYSQTLQVSAGLAPFDWTSSTLPDGLSLTSDGLLSGMPTTVGATMVDITVTDANGSINTLTANMNVLMPPVSIQTTSLSIGDKYQDYSFNFVAINGGGSNQWAIGDGELPAGITLENNGLLTGKATESGSFEVDVVVTDVSSVTATQSFTLIINPAPLILSTTQINDAMLNTAYSTNLLAEEGTAPYSWVITIGSLPTGMTLSSSGVLSGTPTDLNSTFFTVEVTDKMGKTQSQMLSLYIDASELIISSNILPDGNQNKAFTAKLEANGGTEPYTWRIASGALPTGMNLSTNGLVSGTPTQSGDFPISFLVTDANEITKTKTVSLTVTPSELIVSDSVNIVTSTLTSGNLDTVYEAALLAEGGGGNYTWNIIEGNLPAGFSLENGIISGKTSVDNVYPLTVQVTDSLGNKDTKGLTLVINSPTPTITTRTKKGGAIGLLPLMIFSLFILFRRQKKHISTQFKIIKSQLFNAKKTLKTPSKAVLFVLISFALSACLPGDKTVEDTSLDTRDLYAPVILFSELAGELAADSETQTLAIISDEVALCKYDTREDTLFDNMANTFVNTNAKNHESPLNQLVNGESYTYYIRCRDNLNNTNDKDYRVNFSIALTAGSSSETLNDDTVPPVRYQSIPASLLVAGTTQTALGFTTDEVATCKYSDVENQSFDDMANTFNANDNTHRIDLTELNNGNAYTYYARCRDALGNTNNTDYILTFSVATGDDIYAPILSRGAPTGILSTATTKTHLSLETNENATCKFSQTENTNFDTMESSFLFSGRTFHGHPLSDLTEGGVYTYFIRCTDSIGNRNINDYSITFSIHDTNAPILSEETPIENQLSGTTQLDLVLTTNENATCKLGTTADITFENLPSTFETTGGTTHSITVNELSDGNSYSYYARCEDTAGNANTSDYTFNFLIPNPLDLTPPVISNGLPNVSQPVGTQTITLSATTDENAVCKYSTSPWLAYDEMTYTFSDTGALTHQNIITGLNDGITYNYYVRCQDISENFNTENYTISVNVLAPVASGTPWSYVGIPYTDWAYNPFTIQLTEPSEWPTAPADTFYYVEQNHPDASDTPLNNELEGDFGRFGYPERPRKTIPSNSWMGDSYSAGTKIWIKGGTFTGQAGFHKVWSAEYNGTAAKPIWIYGDPTDKPIFKNVQIQMYNTSHTIFDNLQWIGENTANGSLSITRDRDGPSHHITLRNLHFENLNFIGGGGAIVGISSKVNEGTEIHNIVAYKNTFKNNGGGSRNDWVNDDEDHHGFKVDGLIDGNKTYRIWIIDNKAVAGDAPDPLDGLYKSLSGNLVQVGDQKSTSGGVHHVYVAGNYQEFARQALGWTKRSHDVIFSENHCTETYNLGGGNGQCFGHQYDAQYNWWISNIASDSAAGWMHTSNDNTPGPFFVIGNVFHGNTKSDRDEGWRTCAGVSLNTQKGEHYFVNNVFDNSCYGIWAQTNRHRATDKLHIYNNIFTNFSATVDTSPRALSLEISNGLQVYMENNLFGTYNNDIYYDRRTLATLADLNNESWASNNIVGDPKYVDQPNANYNIGADSAAIDAGTQRYDSGATDVYQQFIDRYTNDINYPGDPADYWPKDYLKQNRVIGGVIDIGAHEKQ